MRFETVEFRPASGRIVTIVVAAAALAVLVSLVLESGPAGLARWAWPALLAVCAAWAVYWRPVVRVAEHEIEVRNVLRTHHVPWAAVQNVDTKWALTITTDSRRIGAWAAPAPSRHATGRIDPNDVRLVTGTSRAGGLGIRPGDSLGTVSGAAGFVVRRRWEELREAGALDVAPGARRIRTRWHAGTAAALLLLAAASVAGALL